MNVVQVAVTTVATLLAVVLGGWLSIRAQDRLWRRDHERQWRDIRLSAYTEFVNAFREYVAFILRPEVNISTATRPRAPYDQMPFFDEAGTRYKERLETTKTAMRLVTDRPAVLRSSSNMVHQARQLAASRATLGFDALPSPRFDALWAAEREFLAEARAELGLAGRIDPSPREAIQADDGSFLPIEVTSGPGEVREARPK